MNSNEKKKNSKKILALALLGGATVVLGATTFALHGNKNDDSINRKLLNQTIANIEAQLQLIKNESSFSNEIEEIANLINESKKIANSKNSDDTYKKTREELNNKFEELIKFITLSKKDELKSNIDLAIDLNKNHSSNTLENVIEKADDFYSNEKSTIFQLNDINSELVELMSSIVKADLISNVELANLYLEDLKSDEKYFEIASEIESAINNSNKLLKNDSTNLVEYQDANKQLNEILAKANQSLIEVNKNKLNDLINTAQDFYSKLNDDKYNAISEKLEKEIENGNVVLNSENLTVEILKEAQDKLIEAIQKSKNDKNELDKNNSENEYQDKLHLLKDKLNNIQNNLLSSLKNEDEFLIAKDLIQMVEHLKDNENSISSEEIDSVINNLDRLLESTLNKLNNNANSNNDQKQDLINKYLDLINQKDELSNILTGVNEQLKSELESSFNSLPNSDEINIKSIDEIIDSISKAEETISNIKNEHNKYLEKVDKLMQMCENIKEKTFDIVEKYPYNVVLKNEIANDLYKKVEELTNSKGFIPAENIDNVIDKLNQLWDSTHESIVEYIDKRDELRNQLDQIIKSAKQESENLQQDNRDAFSNKLNEIVLDIENKYTQNLTLEELQNLIDYSKNQIADFQTEFEKIKAKQDELKQLHDDTISNELPKYVNDKDISDKLTKVVNEVIEEYKNDIDELSLQEKIDKLNAAIEEAKSEYAEKRSLEIKKNELSDLVNRIRDENLFADTLYSDLKNQIEQKITELGNSENKSIEEIQEQINQLTQAYNSLKDQRYTKLQEEINKIYDDFTNVQNLEIKPEVKVLIQPQIKTINDQARDKNLDELKTIGLDKLLEIKKQEEDLINKVKIINPLYERISEIQNGVLAELKNESKYSDIVADLENVIELTKDGIDTDLNDEEFTNYINTAIEKLNEAENKAKIDKIKNNIVELQTYLNPRIENYIQEWDPTFAQTIKNRFDMALKNSDEQSSNWPSYYEELENDLKNEYILAIERLSDEIDAQLNKEFYPELKQAYQEANIDKTNLSFNETEKLFVNLQEKYKEAQQKEVLRKQALADLEAKINEAKNYMNTNLNVTPKYDDIKNVLSQAVLEADLDKENLSYEQLIERISNLDGSISIAKNSKELEDEKHLEQEARYQELNTQISDYIYDLEYQPHYNEIRSDLTSSKESIINKLNNIGSMKSADIEAINDELQNSLEQSKAAQIETYNKVKQNLADIIEQFKISQQKHLEIYENWRDNIAPNRAYPEEYIEYMKTSYDDNDVFVYDGAENYLNTENPDIFLMSGFIRGIEFIIQFNSWWDKVGAVVDQDDFADESTYQALNDIMDNFYNKDTRDAFRRSVFYKDATTNLNIEAVDNLNYVFSDGRKNTEGFQKILFDKTEGATQVSMDKRDAIQVRIWYSDGLLYYLRNCLSIIQKTHEPTSIVMIGDRKEQIDYKNKLFSYVNETDTKWKEDPFRNYWYSTYTAWVLYDLIYLKYPAIRPSELS